jgi:hypothetical protein
VHFGGFTYGHGILLFALFGPKSLAPFSLWPALPTVIRANHLGWGVASLVGSHGVSFVWNYLRSGEYQQASLQTLMSQPYSRIVVLHLTVLFGGWVVMLLGSPLGALIVLIALKAAADFRGHVAERQKFAPAAPHLSSATV